MAKDLVTMDWCQNGSINELFWNNVKIPLLAPPNDAFIEEELITSQKQVVKKVIEKKAQRQKVY